MTAATGTVFIAAGAFWLSFTSLADLARRSGIGPVQAWAWPLIVDGVIVVSTVAVVALAGERAAWYPWTLLAGAAAVSITANSIHAVVAADADVPSILAACVAAVPPVVLLAITHLTVVLTSPPDRTARLSPVPAKNSLPPRVRSVPRITPPDPATSLGPPVDAPAGADRLNAAAELRALGWSNKQIAAHLKVAPSTVGRWFAKRPPNHEPDYASDPSRAADQAQAAPDTDERREPR
ncbi:DUF2637 domain-containing protein [Microbacterium sp. 2MCAF23]|uniref:DUF2637 domain-containing protein n=1 Tax=Microbacterium sp. 2MCAF23 TaxID=3232985 RepID=UPI003F9AADAF